MTTRTATVSLSLQAEPAAPQTIPGSLRQHHLRHQQQQLHQHQISSTSSAISEGLGGWIPSTQSSVSKSPSAADVFGLSTDAECDYQTEESSEGSDFGKSVEESCKRSLDHFPNPTLCFPSPALDFDFRLSVKLRSEVSHVQSKTVGNTVTPKEIIAISTGQWSGSFGNGRVLAGGYDLGQARGFRPIRIVEGAFVLQTMDEPPAILELRTRGSLSGPCDVLDTLLSSQQPKDIDPRRYVFRMFSTIKSADKRYAEFVNCALWVASGVWKDDELIIDAYRVT